MMPVLAAVRIDFEILNAMCLSSLAKLRTVSGRSLSARL
jgi:hypothetical protein